jgi:DUF4097 and DUF4098 domain-containing protein YvlB
MYCIVLYVTKVNGSTSLNDCSTKNGQINAATMKDKACCNDKRTNIDVNMKAATTVGNIKESSHGATYANGKDENVLPRAHDLLAGTSESDMGINAMIDTVVTPLAATEVNGQHVNGAESELQNAMDRAAIDIVKGMISFIYFVEQLRMPVEFLISYHLFKLHL